jgi:Rad52/22 family double-strand break repair protein
VQLVLDDEIRSIKAMPIDKGQTSARLGGAVEAHVRIETVDVAEEGAALADSWERGELVDSSDYEDRQAAVDRLINHHDRQRAVAREGALGVLALDAKVLGRSLARREVEALGLLVEGDWLWRSNGAGNTSFEGEKGAYSDAFKRAAVLWGVGRYLYSLTNPWVDIEERGRLTVIKQSEFAKLRQLLTGPPRRSAYAVRLGGDYPKVEKKLRAARTLRSLAAAWKTEQRTISTWPAAWQEHITAEKDRCKELLAAPLTAEERSGLMRDFRDSVALLNGRDLHGEQP